MARPLDKIVKGVRLTRDPAIEAAIDVALAQPLDKLCARAGIDDKQSSDYLPSECLVHLIRHAIRQSNGPLTHNAVANGLLPFLLKRCEANLKVKISDRIATAQDIREEILARLALMFANEAVPDGKYRLDFYEVKFNRAFKLFRIDVLRAELNRINRAEKDGAGQADGASQEKSGDVPIEQIVDKIAAPECDPVDEIFRKQMKPKVVAAIRSLPNDQMTAVMLRYYYDFQVEADDPKEITVAKLCNVSGRTIRNRLARANATLAEILKEAK